VILTATHAAGASVVAGRILDRVADLAIPHSGGEVGRVTLSVGIAMSLPQAGITPESLISAADAALYQAKHAGRNRFVLDQATAAAQESGSAQPGNPS